jgi:hypothetical protein
MSLRLAHRLSQFAVGAACCVLSGIVALEWMSPIGEPPMAAGNPAAASRVVADPDVARADLDALTTTVLERPLFTAGRRPPPSAEDDDNEDDDDDDAPAPVEARLAGIFIGPDRSEALFDKDGDESIAVPEGGDIEGWTVDMIETDRVVLSSASGEVVLLPTPVDPAALAAKRRTAAAKKRNSARQASPPATQTVTPGTVRAAPPATVAPPGKARSTVTPSRTPQGKPVPARPPSAESPHPRQPAPAAPLPKSAMPSSSYIAPVLAAGAASSGRDP